MMELFFSEYQVVIDDAAVGAWASMHTERLEDLNTTDFKISRQAVGVAEGTPTGILEIGFEFSGTRSQGVWYARIVPVAGKMLHVATIASKRNAAKARRAIDQLMDGLEYGHPAQSTEELYGVITAEPEFEADLPAGWRKPVVAETAAVRELAAKTGESNIDGEKCWVAIQTVPVGDPDLMLFCKAHWFLDPIDDHSWAGVEEEVHARFFGKSPEPVEHGEQISVGDRMGFLYRPAAPGMTLRLAVASFDKGVVVGWGLAQADRAEIFDAAFLETLKSTRFTGPEGGAPIHGGLHWIHYWSTYRRTDPVLLGPLFLVFVLLGLGLKRLLKKPEPVAEADGFIDETEELMP